MICLTDESGLRSVKNNNNKTKLISGGHDILPPVFYIRQFFHHDNVFYLLIICTLSLIVLHFSYVRVSRYVHTREHQRRNDL